MTTDFNFLQGIPNPQAVEEVDYEVILDEIIGGLRTELPDWTASTESSLYRAARRRALREVDARQRANVQFRQGLVAFATGTNLDNIAALVGITRNDLETDADLRVRIPRTIASQAVGTPDSVRLFAQEALEGVNDVQITVSWIPSDAPSYSIYCAKEGGVALSSDERTAVAQYLNHRDRKILGTVIVVAATTETAYTITVALTYDSRRTSEPALVEASRAAIYGFIDANLRIGQGIYVNGIAAAATVPGVLSASVSAPSANLAATVGRIYKAAKTTAGVTITTTDVAP